MTAAVSTALASIRRPSPHLAFSFNFTNLPTGFRKLYLQKAFARVDQFAVFSQYERSLYADTFDIDPKKIVPVIWTQDAPCLSDTKDRLFRSPYVCAIGGEGRDFALLIDVAKQIGPTIPMIVIARPDSLKGFNIPDHVSVLSNIPSEDVWEIASKSAGVLVPLLSDKTCCGHITIVSAKLLGLPIATTISYATEEYVCRRPNILQVHPEDPIGFAHIVRRLVDERGGLRSIATSALSDERELHNRKHWARYLDTFVRSTSVVHN